MFAQLFEWLVPYAYAVEYRPYYKVGRGCRTNTETEYVVVHVEGSGDSTTYVVEMRQHGRTCGYAVV